MKYRKINTSRRNVLLAATALSFSGVTGAYAQEVDQIVVTAQKKEQSLQDVPFTVSATTGERLDELRVHDVLDLQAITPGLFTPSSGTPGEGASFRLRGFGSPPFQLGIEPAVATFVDGVYRARSGVSVNDLVDIERVEILKGPQGTLFGKNTTAGVVHLLTKKPVIGETEGFIEGSYEEYARFRARGALNVPLGENVAARITGSWAEGGGWIQNVGPQPDQNDLDRYAIRGQLYFEPTDSMNFRVIVDASSLDENCCATVRLADGPFTGPIGGLASAIGFGVISPPDIEEKVTSVNDVQTNEADEWGISAEGNVGLGENVTLTSITSYRDFENTTLVDGDFTGADLLIIDTDIAVKSFTQELRLAGEWATDGLGGPIGWMAGFYYTNEEIERLRVFDWQSQVGFYFPPFLAPAPGVGVIDDLEQSASSYALFANLEVPLTERLLFTGGFRYNIERKDGMGVFQAPNPIVLFPVNPSFDVEVNEEEPTWSTSLQYDWSDNIMTYFQYARGYKAGGINLSREGAGVLGGPTDATFLAETVDHFEIGAKTELFENRMRLNLALFYDNYDDLQNQVFTGVSFFTRNGEGAKIKGIELEGEIALFDGFDVIFGGLVLDTEFKDGTDLGNGPIGGTELGWAPDFSANLGWSQRHPLGDTGFDFFSSGSVLFRSEYRANTAPSTPNALQDSTQIFNAQIGVGADEGRYELSVWCRNCFDETYSDLIFSSPVDFFPGFGAATETFLGRPRETGVTLRVNF